MKCPCRRGGVGGDESYKMDFLRNRRTTAAGLSLKDFDLRTRLFKHRCSYMIYSPVFTGLPPEMKQRVYAKLGQALSLSDANPEFAQQPLTEKRDIRAILKATLTDLPQGW